MALSRRRRSSGNGLDAWPGYVDALSTLLLVIIFVLLVFVLGQAFLSVALSGRQKALERLSAEVAQLSQMLSLERTHEAALRASEDAVTASLVEKERQLGRETALSASQAARVARLTAQLPAWRQPRAVSRPITWQPRDLASISRSTRPIPRRLTRGTGGSSCV